jgi:hypothetical protein
MQRADINRKRQTRFCREMLDACGFQICRSNRLSGGLETVLLNQLKKAKAIPIKDGFCTQG